MLKLVPDHPMAHYCRGLARVRKGQQAEGRADIAAAAAAQPDIAQAAARYGILP